MELHDTIKKEFLFDLRTDILQQMKITEDEETHKALEEKLFALDEIIKDYSML